MLAEVFDAATVARLAGPRVYPRGAIYVRDGRVEQAQVRGDGRMGATVRGTMPYFVQLWADRSSPRWSCTCPAAEDGSFCKHVVAAALSLGSDESPPLIVPVVGDDRRRGGSAAGRPSESDTDLELSDFVRGLPQHRLAEVVLDRATSDWRLRERLLADARAARGTGADLAEWRRRIDRAFRVSSRRGFVAYDEAHGWAAGVDEVIDALDDLCDAGHHDAVVRLAEHAHRRTDQSVDYVDDSDGWLNGFSGRLSDLHLRACEAGAPDPVELAARLVELELTSELDGFCRSAAVYADILGEAGLAAFRARLEPHWQRTGAEADDWSDNRYVVRQAMVGWAVGIGDPDALIEAHRRDQILPGDVLEIAQALDGAGRVDEAVAWARQGIAESGSRAREAGDLREFLARKLRERGDGQAAVQLFWQAFASSPSLSAYRRLIEEDDGQDWLRRCCEEIRGVLAAVPGGVDGSTTPGAAFGPFPSAVPRAAGALVDILLYEGQVNAAWDAAHDHGCNAQTWLTIARAREESHPLDAIVVYESAALAIIDRKVAKQYQSAVDLMVRIGRLADSAGKVDRFTSLLEQVRVEHKAKRKLKALLDAQGW